MTEPEPTPKPTPKPINEGQPPASRTVPPAKKKAGVKPLQLVVAGLAILLVVVLALVGTASYWAPALPWFARGGQRDQASIAALTTRLARDEARAKGRVDRLEAAASEVKSLSARVARLDTEATKVRSLADRVAHLEARPIPTKPAAVATPVAPPAELRAVAALKAEVAKLAASSATAGGKLAKLAASSAAAGGKLATLEARTDALAARNRGAAARLIALANLRQALEGSRSYAAELTAVAALSRGKAAKKALTPLEADAKSGLPSLATLTEQFDRKVAPAILRARGVTTGRGFGQQILARIERLVVIRRITPGARLPHDPVAAAVVRAEDSLRRGDLSRAVAALDHLPPASAAAAAPWLKDARRRVAAEAALDKLWRAETARLAAADRPAGSKP